MPLQPNHCTVDDLVEYYYRFLSRNPQHETQFGQFKKRLKADQKAAEAEAVIFSLLRAEGLTPNIFEDPGTGGPDFVCNPDTNRAFLVEVTSLDSASLSVKSGLPPEVTVDGRAAAFGLVTAKLLGAVKSKTRQLSGQQLPAVLVVTSDYPFSGLLLGRGAADDLMISATTLQVPLNGEMPYTTTDLREAAFCQQSLLVDAQGKTSVASVRRTVSAVLLASIAKHETEVVGLLHPDPVRKFESGWFPQVPYVQFKHWPWDDKVETEWLFDGDDAEGKRFEHRHLR